MVWVQGVTDRLINDTFDDHGSDDPSKWTGVIPQFFLFMDHQGGAMPRATFNGQLCKPDGEPGVSSDGVTCPIPKGGSFALNVEVLMAPLVQMHATMTFH